MARLPGSWSLLTAGARSGARVKSTRAWRHAGPVQRYGRNRGGRHQGGTHMIEQPVLRAERDGVLELVLNRPAKLNALTNEMFRLVRAGVDDLRDREDLKVMLIRAKGRYFCAGVDQVQGEKAPQLEGPAAVRAHMRVVMGGGMHALYEEMERVEKPIVVAHHAPCVGGGLEMSLSCDFRLA